MPETKPEPATAGIDSKDTTVGSVFVSNYPPYSVWGESDVPAVQRALGEQPRPDATLGLYLHIPFCRKRCKFCYFRVYTDKNSSEIDTYLNALAKEGRTLQRTTRNCWQASEICLFRCGNLPTSASNT